MNAIGQLGQLYNLSPATIAGLANASGATPPSVADAMPVQDISQLQDAAAGFQAQAAKPQLEAAASTLGSHAVPVQRAMSDEEASRQSFKQLAGVDFKKLQAENAAKEAPKPASAPAVASVQIAPSAGSPARMIPAHWQPGSHEVDVKRGVNPEALLPGMQAKGASLQEAEKAAQQRLHADQLNLRADVQDGLQAAVKLTAARDQLAALDGQRAQYKQQEIARLEALNAQAQKHIDTNEAFRGGAAGRVMAAVMMGLGQFAAMWKGGTNGAMQVVNDAIRDTIEQQKANAAGARAAYADRINLYRDNMQAFGEQRGELATRIQLLGKVAEMADARRAEARDLQNVAGYNQFRAAIDEKRGAMLDEFGKATDSQIAEKMSEHYLAAQMSGGPTAKREGNLVTLPDGSTFVMPSQEVAQKAIEKIQVLDKLQRNNNEILKLRAKASKLDPILDWTDYHSTIQQLKDLGEQKVALTSLALGQGVVKEEEYKRAQEINVGVTNGLGFFKGNPLAASERESTDNMLRAQTKRWAEDGQSYITAAGGEAYQREYAPDAAGRLKPTGEFTGQDATPTQNLAPQGSVPMNGTTTLPTAGPKTTTQIPYAPRSDR